MSKKEVAIATLIIVIVISIIDTALIGIICWSVGVAFKLRYVLTIWCLKMLFFSFTGKSKNFKH